MSSSPFTDDSCPTYYKDTVALQSAGYIDSTGNLVVAHDAATVHLGSPWRMPTCAEFTDLVNNCTTTWITTNGVSGYLVTGKGDYANRSIFLPAAGHGYDSEILNLDSAGYYWSSTPTLDDSCFAEYFEFVECLEIGGFDSGDLSDDAPPPPPDPESFRCDGLSVRPVRGLSQ